MKTATLILIAAVVGGALGGLLGYRSVGAAADPASVERLLSLSNDGAGVGPEIAAPRVDVGERVYDFGVMQRGTKKSHTFTLSNTGGAPLTVSVIDTSCKCTAGDATDEPIPPGGSGKVTLEWEARSLPGEFRQTASLVTNDPLNERITLEVAGRVVDVVGLRPQELNLGKLLANESRTAEVTLLSFEIDDLEVTADPPPLPEHEDAFEVEVIPIDDASEIDPEAKSGVRIQLTSKPGLPVGLLMAQLPLTTNLPEAESIKVPVLGRVEGDLSVHGAGWSDASGVLALGMVPSDTGVERRLLISVKHGANEDISHEDVELEIAQVDPEVLEVELGEPRNAREGVTHFPLTLSIPPGTRPMIRNQTVDLGDGKFQNPEAVVLLKSNLPSTPELKLRVRFTVVSGN